MNDFGRLRQFRDKTIAYCSKLDHSSIILEKEFIDNTHDIYFAYPLLFADLFPSAEFDSIFLEQLSIAGFLLYRSIIIQDRLSDHDDSEKVARFGVDSLSETIKYCHQVAFQIFGDLFPSHSEFWSFLTELKEEHVKETHLEKSIESNSQMHKCLCLFEQLSYFKANYGRLSIDALFSRYVATIEDASEYAAAWFQHNFGINTYKKFAFLLQIIDDIEDFNKDFHTGQANIAIKLTKILFSSDCELESLKKHFYFSGIAPCLFAKICSLSDSIRYETKGRLQILSKLVSSIQYRYAKQSIILQNYVKTKDFSASYSFNLYPHFDIRTIVQQIEEQITRNVQDQAIKNGMIGVVRHATSSFKESFHFMYMPSDEGLIQSGVFVGTVFPLSLIAQLLQQVCDRFAPLLSVLILPIQRYLLSKRQKNYHWTWCYLDGFDYLSPDIDDMSQIIRGLGADLRDERCMETISYIINRIIDEGKPVTTWIPPIVKTPVSEIQEKFNNEKWGDTIDIEVVANLLLMLDSIVSSDIENLSAARDILLHYVEDSYGKCMQGEILPSRWYYSSIYPIYLLSKLQCANLSDELKQRFVYYLMTAQNNDGGWGNDYEKNRSDALNTSLAVIALRNLSEKDRILTKQAIASGVKLIRNLQSADGLWEKVNFIKARFEDPYHSRLATTSFCIEALITDMER